MSWIKKHLYLLLFVVVIYAAYFATHVKSRTNVTVLGANTNLVLYEEPKDSYSPLITVLQHAQKEIDIEMYLLTDKQVISTLLDERGKGVIVKVLLEQHPAEGSALNKKTQQLLVQGNIAVEWTNPSFALTHEKSITVDGIETCILNQNLTASSFSKNREYDICDANPEDVSEVEKIFNADWNRTTFIPTDPHLVVSPDTARSGLINILTQATSSIVVEMEVIDDQSIENLLETKAAKMPVQVIVEDPIKVTSNKKTINELTSHGVQVKIMKKPYLHAKFIDVDNSKAYIGSVNLTTPSMDENREVGIIVSQPDILQQLASDFASDWDQATSY